jgi:cytidylate kinase
MNTLTSASGSTVVPISRPSMTTPLRAAISRWYSTDDITLEQLERDIAARDKFDEEREVSPLRCSEDAIVLDTTHMGIQDVVDTIVSYCLTEKDGEISQ